MAQKGLGLVQLVDALDESDPATEEVHFSLDGRHRKIFLSAANAAAFRALMDPYMAAGRPADPDDLAAKGFLDPMAQDPRDLPDPNQLCLFDFTPGVEASQAEYRRESARIRKWAARNGLPINNLGRIPTRIREAWRHDTIHGDRSKLNELLTEIGVDPSQPPARTEPPAAEPLPPEVAAADRLTRQARTIKLQDHQSSLLRAAARTEDGTATAADTYERASYEALRRRAVMIRVGTGSEYRVTDLGHAWVRINEPAMSA